MQSYSKKMLSKIDSSKNMRRNSDTFNVKTSMYSIGDIRVFPVILDMDTVDVIRTPIKFKQYDYGTCFINFQLVEGETPIVLDGVSTVGNFRNKANNEMITSGGYNLKSHGEVLSISDGVIKVEIPKGILLFPGEIECEILLFDINHNRSTSPRVIFYIEESLNNHEGDVAFTEDLRYSLLTDLMRNVTILNSDAERLININSKLHDEIKSNEDTRILQENARQVSMSNIQSTFISKVEEVDYKINEVNVAIAAGTQDLEIKQARIGQDGKVYDCLNDRLNAIENNPYVLFETIEG